jgi:NTE family protein
MRAQRAAAAAMNSATTYEEWRRAAEVWETHAGADRWRDEPTSRHYHADLIRRQLDDLQALRAAGRVEPLLEHLHESLHRNLGDLEAPELYATSPLGTKHLIERYLSEIESTIEWLAGLEAPGFEVDAKRAVLQRAGGNLGRSALLLSGGATLGFYHLGVVRALWLSGLLPDVISGASMGAMVAAGVGARTDAELDALFAPDLPDIERIGLQIADFASIRSRRALLDPSVLMRTIEANCGDWTFAEAFERSGRTLNISVAPVRIRQKPRVLNHLTSPDVLVKSAALASSAVPGLFPPVTLMRRARDGTVRPYSGTEQWIDGSFGGDLPMSRLARLHNINHFIVSQVNPHILPFSEEGRRTATGFALRMALGPALRGGLRLLSAGRALTPRGTVGHSLNLLLSLAEQDYGGDIDIQPRFDPGVYLKVLKNPSREDLRYFVLEGQRATWPKLAMIRDQTRIARCLARCEAGLA